MPDLIGDLLGLDATAPLARLRADRPGIQQHIEGTYRALVHPITLGGLTRQARAAIAQQAARAADPGLAAHYAALAPAADPALLAYAERVGQAPGSLRQADIDALLQAGRSPQDIVAITQLAAYVPFQVRLLAGLRALLGYAGQPAPMPHPAAAAFTMAEAGWHPRIPPVDAATATPEQLAALDACPPAVRRTAYFLTLALDPASLAERGALFNAVMYAPRGLPRADRELATAVVSMVNGCVYCCSVHARRFAELTHEHALMQRLLDEGFGIPLDRRPRAIVDAAALLTAAPAAFGAAHVAALRSAGLADLELLDLIHAIAMFANANRLMQALGECAGELTRAAGPRAWRKRGG